MLAAPKSETIEFVIFEGLDDSAFHGYPKWFQNLIFYGDVEQVKGNNVRYTLANELVLVKGDVILKNKHGHFYKMTIDEFDEHFLEIP